jgi:hypothetical protein
MPFPKFEGRDDPKPNTPDATKANWLRAAEDWLDPSRLPEDHRVRGLFDRKDWVATCELYVVGDAVERMKSKSLDGLRSLGKRAVEPDEGNAIGAVFEATIGALFDRPDHPVTVMPENTRGYDLSIALPNGKTLRASCKARIPSGHEIRFRSFIRSLDFCLARRLPAGSSTVIIIRCDQRPSDEAAYVAAHVDAIIAKHREWRRLEVLEFKLPCGRGTLKPLVDLGGKTFWQRAPSYTLLGALSFGENEQVRFRDRLKEAIEKFRTHCNDVSDDVGNIVFMKIPTSIRIDDARKLSDELLATAGRQVAGVYVYRTQIAGDPGGRQFYLCHELHEFDNPKAERSTRSYLPEGFTFVITPNVGRVQNVEPVLTLRHDEGETLLTETHVEMRGRLNYFADARRGVTLNFDRPPDHHVTYVLRRRGRHETMDFGCWPAQLVLI